MVFWPKLSLRVQKERSQKHFLFGPKVSELGPNVAHLARQENALIFILRLLLRRTFSFLAFSYNAYFHFPPSPMTLIFIPHLLLWRLFSFPTLSYCAYFYFAQKPNTGTLPVKLPVHGIKDMRDERPPSPPTLLGINPPAHAPFMPGQRGDH